MVIQPAPAHWPSSVHQSSHTEEEKSCAVLDRSEASILYPPVRRARLDPFPVGAEAAADDRSSSCHLDG